MQEIIEKEIKAILEILKKKDADYSGDTPLSNFNMAKLLGISPFQGVLLRMGDKFSRICSLSKKAGEVKEETIKDTLRDLAGYALIALAIRERENEDAEIQIISGRWKG